MGRGAQTDPSLLPRTSSRAKSGPTGTSTRGEGHYQPRHMSNEKLKDAARGHWIELLADLGGISRELLDGKHHPCPKCGGSDRFRMIDEEAGALFCNQCFRTGNGDGIAALQWVQGWPVEEAIRRLGERLRIN